MRVTPRQSLATVQGHAPPRAHHPPDRSPITAPDGFSCRFAPGDPPRPCERDRLDVLRRTGQQPERSARFRRELQPARARVFQPRAIGNDGHAGTSQRRVDRPQPRARVGWIDPQAAPKQRALARTRQRRRIGPRSPPDPHDPPIGTSRRSCEVRDEEQGRGPAAIPLPDPFMRRTPSQPATRKHGIDRAPPGRGHAALERASRLDGMNPIHQVRDGGRYSHHVRV